MTQNLAADNIVNGWVIIDKPIGMTSASVVGRLKKLWQLPRALKIGHGGTLDPMATGVLPIALGEATKTVAYVMDGRKAYDFTMQFGTSTDTEDAEGQVTATSAVRPSVAAIKEILPRFVGGIMQRPPAYAALKINGQRAYDLARAGAEVVLAPRQVTIHALDFVEQTDESHMTLRVACGKGTYVRALARDIALALGGLAHLTALRRTQVGRFGLAQAISLAKCAEISYPTGIGEVLCNLTEALDDIPALSLTPEQAFALQQGRVVRGFAAFSGSAVAQCAGTPVALVTYAEGGLRVQRGFNLKTKESLDVDYRRAQTSAD